MHVQIKDGRVELARKRQEFDLYVYGERRDSEQPEAANLSAWRIAIVKEECTYKSKDGRVGYARKQSYKLVPVPEETSLSAYALQRKEKNYGRQEDSLQDLSQRRRDA